METGSGGIASLNPRLIAGKPPASGSAALMRDN